MPKTWGSCEEFPPIFDTVQASQGKKDILKSVPKYEATVSHTLSNMLAY